MIADGINNLSDMGSSVITLVGFKLASAPADKEHPYGHQRIEYIAGLIVSMIIIFVGGNLFFSSFNKIIHYEMESVSNTVLWISIGILSLSILVKMWQSYFNKKSAIFFNRWPYVRRPKTAVTTVLRRLPYCLPILCCCFGKTFRSV